MSHALSTRIVGAILMLLLAFTPLALTFAHGDEDHGDEKHERVLSEAEMKQIISLLQQVIALMVKQKSLPTTSTPAASAPVADHSHTDEAEDHVEDHTATTPQEKKLLIEVEEHFGRTHVHARYVDKAEEQFFVEVKMSDEAALVAAIVGKTGLTETEVKAALKYL